MKRTRTRRLATPVFAIAAMLVMWSLAACARHTPSAESAPSGCNGRRDVVVTNNWSQAVEIFTRVGATPVQSYVGTVNAGRQMLFHLPDGARFASARAVGSTNPQDGLPASARDLVDLRYLCE